VHQADQADAVLGDRDPARQRRIGRAGNSWLGVAAWLDEYGVPGDAASTAAWIDWPAAR